MVALHDRQGVKMNTLSNTIIINKEIAYMYMYYISNCPCLNYVLYLRHMQRPGNTQFVFKKAASEYPPPHTHTRT